MGEWQLDTTTYQPFLFQLRWWQRNLRQSCRTSARAIWRAAEAISLPCRARDSTASSPSSCAVKYLGFWRVAVMRKNSRGFSHRFCQAYQMLIDDGKHTWKKTERLRSGVQEKRGRQKLGGECASLQEIVTDLQGTIFNFIWIKGNFTICFLSRLTRLSIMLALSFMPNISSLKVKHSINRANQDAPMLTAANKVNIKDRHWSLQGTGWLVGQHSHLCNRMTANSAETGKKRTWVVHLTSSWNFSLHTASLFRSWIRISIKFILSENALDLFQQIIYWLMCLKMIILVLWADVETLYAKDANSHSSQAVRNSWEDVMRFHTSKL